MKSMKKSLWWVLCLTMLTVLVASSVNQAISAESGETGAKVQAQVDKPEQPSIVPINSHKSNTESDSKKFPNNIFIYALILALFIGIPTIIDVIMAYHSWNKNWQILLDKASKDSLDKEKIQALIAATTGGPPGISGMSRSLMAFAVIIILGIALFHLMVYCSGPQNEKITTIISNVLSMLGATLASITGFYFGGRSAEERGKASEAQEAQRQQQRKAPGPQEQAPKPQEQAQKPEEKVPGGASTPEK